MTLFWPSEGVTRLKARLCKVTPVILNRVVSPEQARPHGRRPSLRVCRANSYPWSPFPPRRGPVQDPVLRSSLRGGAARLGQPRVYSEHTERGHVTSLSLFLSLSLARALSLSPPAPTPTPQSPALMSRLLPPLNGRGCQLNQPHLSVSTTL